MFGAFCTWLCAILDQISQKLHFSKFWLHFGPLFLEIRSTDFGIVLPIASAYDLLLILRI